MTDLGAASAPLYPVMLDLRGRLVVVIGGGAVAEQKVRELVTSGARVRVVSPALSPALEALAADGAVEGVRRSYALGDLRGAWLAVAATDDRSVNRAVWEEAEAAGVLLNAVDDVEHCHFIAPSVHREGDITVTVSTAGRCPTLAVRLREQFAKLVRREHAELARLAGSLRAEVARRVPPFAARRALWYRVVDSAALEFLRRGDDAAARAEIEALVREFEPQRTQRAQRAQRAQRNDDVRSSASSASSAVQDAEHRPVGAGVVYLVGAGPGDAGLITVRGLELLRSADAVVHDRLVGPELLLAVRPDARLIAVGKCGHGDFTSQREIEAILVREARAGRRVVRLKGGDPFVFGRGAEEVAALRGAGIPVEVVPGITSAIAAPAAAGIPVTTRGLSSGFAVVTGHVSADGDEEAALDWGALARIPTLVVLMGLRALPRIAARLRAHGLDADTPAAVISRGTQPDQRVVVGTLATIAERAAAARLEQPATLVVGRVVSLYDREAVSSADDADDADDADVSEVLSLRFAQGQDRSVSSASSVDA
jgi:uroporphyrin-III C-methyltransferase/precorrin-2 dehydrogenase/sirohydrochlorin ferrochelatase